MKMIDSVRNWFAHAKDSRFFRKIGEISRPLGKIPRRVLWVAGVLLLVGAGAFGYYMLVYLPSQTSEEPALQTATVRQGELVISASGSGTLIARDEVNLGFQTAGEVTDVLVRVGDSVKKGDVLAKVDDEDARIQLAQAKRALQELTSAASIATAQGDIATAQTDLDDAIGHLAYLISPNVYHWENELATRQQALADAETKAAASPDDMDAKAAMDTTQEAVTYAQRNLAGAQYSYEHTYIKNNFTVTAYISRKTGKVEKFVEQPSDAEILAARADVAQAQATLSEANYYYAALTGGDVPEDATGSSLTALEQAKIDVDTAQAALDGTTIVATISGTVMSVDATVGDTVKSGTTLITVSDLSSPYLEVYLDESDWAMIKTDAEADITFDILPDNIYKGKVTQVDPGLYTENTSSVVRAYVEMTGDEANSLNLPLGTAAAVEVIGARAENAILVPVEALHKTESGTYAVFVMENGVPKLRVVEIGIQDQLYAQVTSGLQAGEVVTTGITETK